MITEYISKTMSGAKYERIQDELPFYGEIPGFEGVWAQGKTMRECKKNLQEVLEEWLILKIRKKQFMPTKDSYDLNQLIAA